MVLKQIFLQSEVRWNTRDHAVYSQSLSAARRILGLETQVKILKGLNNTQSKRLLKLERGIRKLDKNAPL